MTIYIRPDGTLTGDLSGLEENYLKKGFRVYVPPGEAPEPEPEAEPKAEAEPAAAPASEPEPKPEWWKKKKKK